MPLQRQGMDLEVVSEPLPTNVTAIKTVTKRQARVFWKDGKCVYKSDDDQVCGEVVKLLDNGYFNFYRHLMRKHKVSVEVKKGMI